MYIVVVSQNGCNPCQMVKNFIKNEDIEFTEVNISTDSDAIEKYGVMSTPVTILFDGDEEIARVVGYNPPDIETLISQL